MNRSVKIVLVLVMLLVLGLVVVSMIFPSGGGNYRREVEAYKRDLLAKGEKLDLAELYPARSNDLERTKRFVGMVEEYQRPANPVTLMRMVVPGVAAVGFSNLAPAEMPGHGRNATNVSKLREILGTSVLALSSDYSKGQARSFGPALYLGHLRIAEELAGQTLMQALARHDHEQARADLFLAVDLPRLYRVEPSLVCDLVRNATSGEAVGATWEALQASQWSDAELAELQAKWQNLTQFQNIGPVLRGERVFGITAMAEFRQTNEFSEAMSGSSGGSGVADWLGDVRDQFKDIYNRYPGYWKWRDVWSYDQELFMLQEYAAVQECARQAQTTGAVVPALREFDRENSRIGMLHAATTNHYMGLLLFPDELSDWLHRNAEMETAQRITVTAIALKRYQLAHNAFPASLSGLVPQYLAEVSADFMDGQPLRYKVQPDGNFLLYSVGEDGVDDGGDPTPTAVANNWLKGRDIVWPRAATAKEIEDYQKAQKADVSGN